jgi:ribosome maturation protein Sdo1
MTRGNGQVTKVFFKGQTDDFIVFIESADDLKAWKKDQSIPLAQVVNSFKIMLTHKHGAQGQLDSASKASLENEFGTSNEDEVIKKILMEGQPQTFEVCPSFSAPWLVI